MMTGKFRAMPKIQMPVVDVRDVAYAHLQALKVEEAKNKRFILSEKSMWLVEICTVLKNHYGDGFKLNNKEVGYCPVKMAACFN